MKKRKFKMPSSFTILFFIIVVVAILTWIVPTGEYVYVCDGGADAVDYTDPGTGELLHVCPVNGEARLELEAAKSLGASVDSSRYTVLSNSSSVYREIESEPQGIWQVINAPTQGFYDAIEIALFVMIIGGFINVVMKTGTLDAGINNLLKKFKGREHILIPILMILFALGGTTYGMAEETIAFYILVVPIFYRAGYDAITGVMVILLGAGVGVLASTVNPFAIGVAAEAAGVGLGDGIIGRFILWGIVTVATIFYVMKYAKKVKNDPTKSIVYDLKDEYDTAFIEDEVQIEEMETPHKVVLALFIIAFAMMIISVIPWEDFGVMIFSQIADFINANLLFISGRAGVIPFGEWYFAELTTLFLVFGVIIGIYANKKKILTDSFIDVFIDGTKDMIGVALIIALARGIQVIMASSGMDATLLFYGSQAMAGLGKTLFTAMTFLFFIPLSFLIPSTSGLATASMPVMGALGTNLYGNTDGAVQVITAFSGASGIVNLITPTSGVVMGGLALAHVPYDRWLRVTGKFILFLIVLVMLYLVFLSTVNFYM